MDITIGNDLTLFLEAADIVGVYARQRHRRNHVWSFHSQSNAEAIVCLCRPAPANRSLLAVIPVRTLVPIVLDWVPDSYPVSARRYKYTEGMLDIGAP